MRKESVVKEVTSGMCGALIDFLLWQVALVGASFGKSGPRGVHQAFSEADAFLQQINHKTLAAVWHQLTKKRLVTYKKRQNLYTVEITEFGRKRLNSTFPQYQKVRPWDKRIYLITYDIPELARKKRDKLRRFLEQIGCRILQKSTYLTPYNPRQLVNEISRKIKIPGTIIVSDIGKDGGIGETNIQDLLVKLYSLESLNEKYENFIKKTKEKRWSLRNLIFEYFSILKDDPQLPFELLPKGWLGEKAYLYYQILKKDYILSLGRSPRK